MGEVSIKLKWCCLLVEADSRRMDAIDDFLVSNLKTEKSDFIQKKET